MSGAPGDIRNYFRPVRPGNSAPSAAGSQLPAAGSSHEESVGAAASPAPGAPLPAQEKKQPIQEATTVSISSVKHSLPSAKRSGSFFLIINAGLGKGQTAYLNYDSRPGILDIVHTSVPAAFRGKGVAKMLCDAAFEYAAENNVKVVPSCTYVRQTYLPNAAPSARAIVAREGGAPAHSAPAAAGAGAGSAMSDQPRASTAPLAAPAGAAAAAPARAVGVPAGYPTPEDDMYPPWKFLRMPYHPDNAAKWAKIQAVCASRLRNPQELVNAFYLIHRDADRDLRPTAQGIAHYLSHPKLTTDAQRAEFFTEILPFIQVLVSDMPKVIAECCTWGNPLYMPLLRRRSTASVSELTLSRIAIASLNAGAFFAIFSLPETIGEKESKRGNYNFFSFERILANLGFRDQQRGKLECILQYFREIRARVMRAVKNGDPKLKNSPRITGCVSFYRRSLQVGAAWGDKGVPKGPVNVWEAVQPDLDFAAAAAAKRATAATGAHAPATSAAAAAAAAGAGSEGASSSSSAMTDEDAPLGPSQASLQALLPGGVDVSGSSSSSSTSSSSSSSGAAAATAAAPGAGGAAAATTTTTAAAVGAAAAGAAVPGKRAQDAIITLPMMPSSGEVIRHAQESSAALVGVDGVEKIGFEDETVGQTLQIDFANMYLGGGVLRSGCVQEEIRFLICPECLPGLLFSEVMDRGECIVIVGLERFSNYAGYSSTFRFAGPHDDPTPCDGRGRVATAFLAIDALIYDDVEQQFNMMDVGRELVKAYCAFSFPSDPLIPDSVVQDSRAKARFNSSANYEVISTGNWGCGAFRGDVQLKFVIQWIAATLAGRPIRYFPFTDPAALGVEAFAREVRKAGVNVSTLFAMLRGFTGEFNEVFRRRIPGESVFSYISSLL